MLLSALTFFFEAFSIAFVPLDVSQGILAPILPLARVKMASKRFCRRSSGADPRNLVCGKLVSFFHSLVHGWLEECPEGMASS